jgi:predicted nuclease with TOPRIM domain
MQLSECERKNNLALEQISNLKEMLEKMSQEKVALENRFQTLKEEFKRIIRRFTDEKKENMATIV